jgi:hypothetical protein
MVRKNRNRKIKLSKELVAKNGSHLDANNCDGDKGHAVIKSNKCEENVLVVSQDCLQIM